MEDLNAEIITILSSSDETLKNLLEERSDDNFLIKKQISDRNQEVELLQKKLESNTSLINLIAICLKTRELKSSDLYNQLEKNLEALNQLSDKFLPPPKKVSFGDQSKKSSKK